MPSKSPKQANLMRAVAHGFKPDRIKGPSVAVAKEFLTANKGKMARVKGMTQANSGGYGGSGRTHTTQTRGHMSHGAYSMGPRGAKSDD